MFPPILGGYARRGIVRRVRALFNDEARGERPVQRSDDALFSSDSMIWRVHGDVTTMMVGGMSALLLQMLHPAVLAGVWDHSNFRTDMLGRLRRTARFVAITTYGRRDLAEAAIARVRSVHSAVSGTLSDGTRYRADDPGHLAWVHVAEATSFLDAWLAYGDRPLTGAEQDRYFDEFALIAEALGASPVPRNRAQAERIIADMREAFVVDKRTHEVARLVLEHRPASHLVWPLQAMTAQAAVDLLPDWARRMHGLSGSVGATHPLVSAGTKSLARTLRWAFAGG